MTSELNPPVIVRAYPITTMDIVHVIRDDFLVGGTKQRCLKEYLEIIPQKEIIYAGPSSGYAQIALAYVGRMLGKHITLFLQSTDGELTPLNTRATSYGARLNLIKADLTATTIAAQDYVNGRPKAVLLPYGFDNEVYEQFLVTALIKSLTGIKEPLRVWLVIGSGTLLKALAQVWPHTQFMAVRVGRNIWYDTLSTSLQSRIRVFDATKEYSFIQPIRSNKPPYSSIRNYDAKVWKYVSQYGLDGDYVWNVGKD
jgi:cysteine synthase